jgi:hypothetical protein
VTVSEFSIQEGFNDTNSGSFSLSWAEVSPFKITKMIRQKLFIAGNGRKLFNCIWVSNKDFSAHERHREPNFV